MKYLKLSYHELGVFVTLIGAVIFRLLLTHGYWPLPNSDEATIGLMAMHVQHGELPIFFYGQNYMGALEAYLAAPLFSLFGVSIFTLRLSLILLFTLFLVAMYLLTRILYTKNLALFTIALLSLGSNAIFSRELMAIGGYCETLVFAVLSFVIASWLALSSPSTEQKIRRVVAYSAWGLVTGLGIWSDLLILPFMLCSGLILLLFCRRELFRGAVFPLVLFFLLGAAPFILYNIHAAPGQDSWSVLMSLQGHEPLNALTRQVRNTLTLSLPTITGNPLCHYTEFAWLSYLGYQTSHVPTRQCEVIGASWSLSYLGLFALSMGLVCVALWKKRFLFRLPENQDNEKLKIDVSRFMLGSSGLLTLLLFIHSSAPIDYPAAYSRYMIGLWVITPVVLWPIWKGARSFRLSNIYRNLSIKWLRNTVCVGLLAIVFAVFALGAARTFYELPLAMQAKAQEQGLIDALHRVGITHVYSEYWTCNRLIFETKEDVLCATLDFNLDKGVTRGEQYFVAVSRDSQSSYLFPSGYTNTLALARQRLEQNKIPYRSFTIEDYTVIQPLPIT